VKQLTFASASYGMKKKTTRRERFLAEMDQVVPWSQLLALIEGHYPKASGKGGRPVIPLERMLRIYFLQQWFSLSDPAMEEALYDIESMRRFVGIELNEEAIPDETTLLNFRHLLERERLTEAIFAEVRHLLAERGLLLKAGTLVDATLIAAPSSTKNQAGSRDPEMTQTRKGKQWHFGMKAHIGVDADSGLVHTVALSTAKTADITLIEELLHGEEKIICADRGYDSQTLRNKLIAKHKLDAIAWRRKPGNPLSEAHARFNWLVAKFRAKVEHPFRVLKRQFGYQKVRYRGLAKNAAQLFSLFALVNLFLARRQLAPLQG